MVMLIPVMHVSNTCCTLPFPSHCPTVAYLARTFLSFHCVAANLRVTVVLLRPFDGSITSTDSYYFTLPIVYRAPSSHYLLVALRVEARKVGSVRHRKPGI